MSIKLFLTGCTVTLLSLTSFSAMVCARTLHSSIQVPYHKGAEAKEEINTAHLRSLAKISRNQATKIALKHYAGKLGKVDLENEDGNLIYSVEVGRLEVAVDAGNGKILQAIR